MVPSTLLEAVSVQGQLFFRPLKVLFDSGSNISLIQSGSLPANVQPTVLPTATRGITAAGAFDANQTVQLDSICLPEFSKSKKIVQWQFHFFDTPCPYDIILGRDFFSTFCIDPCFIKQQVVWESISIQFKPRSFWNDPFNVDQCLTDAHAVSIEEASYEQANIQQVVRQQTYLPLHLQSELEEVLRDYPRLFDGSLGRYPHV